MSRLICCRLATRQLYQFELHSSISHQTSSRTSSRSIKLVIFTGLYASLSHYCTLSSISCHPTARISLLVRFYQSKSTTRIAHIPPPPLTKSRCLRVQPQARHGLFAGIQSISTTLPVSILVLDARSNQRLFPGLAQAAPKSHTGLLQSRQHSQVT